MASLLLGAIALTSLSAGAWAQPLQSGAIAQSINRSALQDLNLTSQQMLELRKIHDNEQKQIAAVLTSTQSSQLSQAIQSGKKNGGCPANAEADERPDN